MKTLILMTILLFSMDLNASVIEVKTWIFPGSQPEIREDQFILVDFWATWCAPCIRAMDHLHELNKVTEDRVVYISLSREPEEVVINFFRNREAKTFIAIDNDGKTFDKFQVRALPYAILIAPDGKVIWSGNPSDISFQGIHSLISSKHRAADIANKIRTVKSSAKPKTDKILNFENFNYEFSYSTEEIPFNAFTQTDKLNLSGSLVDMVSYAYDVPEKFIKNESIDQLYGFLTVHSHGEETLGSTLKYLISHIFNIEVWEQSSMAEVYKIEITDESMLWSPEMYEWDSNGKSSYIYWENNLQADNYSVREIAALLTRVMEQSFIYEDDYDDIHDWNLYLGDLQSMKQQLHAEYGINIIQDNAMVKNLQIRQKR